MTAPSKPNPKARLMELGAKALTDGGAQHIENRHATTGAFSDLLGAREHVSWLASSSLGVHAAVEGGLEVGGIVDAGLHVPAQGCEPTLGRRSNAGSQPNA